MNRYFSFILLILFLNSCSTTSLPVDPEKWKQEIRETELAFSAMSDTAGIERAFLEFAAEDAVLMRNNRIINGKSAIAERFASSPPTGKLTWAPHFVDVSASGDLGYTYGQYSYSFIDSTGTTRSSTGIFHTVWKRQEDGSWKFVYD